MQLENNMKKKENKEKTWSLTNFPIIIMYFERKLYAYNAVFWEIENGFVEVFMIA